MANESGKDELSIGVFEVERPCTGGFDESKLALKEVDNSTKHYSKKQILLKDAEIIRVVRSEVGDPDYALSDVTRKYFLGLELGYCQQWKPSGYGLGELISSISLLPNEDLTLEVKTWETSKTQQDKNEQLDSKNISDVKVEKSDVREILDDYQEKTKHKFDAHASATWGWGSASANYGFSNDVQQQHKTLSKVAKDIARKSVNEISSKRSIKMSVSREKGAQDKTTRKIKNINQCRTLNVNHYQVLREYKVSMSLDSTKMLLFGPWVYKDTWDNYKKWGWNLESILMEALEKQPLDSNGTYFQSQVAPHVIPRPEAVRITNEGRPRAIFAYEIIPAVMRGLLDYLFSYLCPNSPPPHMGTLEILKQKDYIQKKQEALDSFALDESVMFVPLVHFLSDVASEKIEEQLDSVAERIVTDYSTVADDVGNVLTEWYETIPTHGIYAETLLGLCSGCEDYFEVQRQFDLETKQLQVELLRLKAERLGLENSLLEQGKSLSTISITDPTDKTKININVTADSDDGTSSVDITKTGETDQ